MTQEPQEELYQMLAELRRREFVARAADNAVLEQHIAIWDRYQVYVINERNKLAKRKEESVTKSPEAYGSKTEMVRSIFNGSSLTRKEVREAVKARYPTNNLTVDQVDRCIFNLVETNEIKRTGGPGRLRFVKSVLSVLVLLPLLLGCRLTAPDDSVSAIMPPRLPPPPPLPLLRSAPVAPTTSSVNLAWDSVPGALTYRVDYGLDGVAMTNSLHTQATDCTIRGLELGRVYHYNVRACDGRTYGPVSNVIIK